MKLVYNIRYAGHDCELSQIELFSLPECEKLGTYHHDVEVVRMDKIPRRGC